MTVGCGGMLEAVATECVGISEYALVEKSPKYSPDSGAVRQTRNLFREKGIGQDLFFQKKYD